MDMRSRDNEPKKAILIGGGPAGLTAALEMLKHDIAVTVLEKYKQVGGIARTESYKDYHFDMGGHRFFTKSDVVDTIWQDIMGDDFLVRPRLSRIYYQKKYFHYPPQILNTLTGLGIFESIRILWSYVWWHIVPYRKVTTFEQWVTNAFGKRLFEIFFKSYTEKVWGISCSELSSEWAVQRIKELSIKVIIQKLFLQSRRQVTTLIEEFRYPRRGPGMMWEKAKTRIENAGSSVLLSTNVTAIHRTGNRIDSVSIEAHGEVSRLDADYFVSSMPITELIQTLQPAPPAAVLQAAQALKHRDFLTVCLIIDEPDLFPDNWIYVHEPEVKVARIQNYKNWSPEMVPDPARSSLGLEYFCQQGDDLWCMDDDALIELAASELAKIELARKDRVIDGCVFRVPNAYPVYDSTYAANLEVVREFCDGLDNLRTVGRNGLHRYNNQDHSMLTALFATRMLVRGEHHDLWKINAEQEYHEERVDAK